MWDQNNGRRPEQTGPQTAPRQPSEDQNGRKRLPKMEGWRQQRNRCADVSIPAESNIRDEEHRKVRASRSMRRLRILLLNSMEWQDDSRLIG